MNDETMEKRLRRSALLIIFGLIGEVVSLTWKHPTSFIVFVLVGGTLMGAGILYYLYSLVTKGG
jgi:hypothetical protein